jgi:hypothetical protein
MREIDENNLTLYKCDMHSEVKGLCIGNNIVINKEISNSDELNCILAEEIGHYKTTVGDITSGGGDSAKQELKARVYAYDRLVGLEGLVRAWENGSRSISETAEYLSVTEAFLRDAIDYYTGKYGLNATFEGKMITFIPVLMIEVL